MDDFCKDTTRALRRKQEKRHRNRIVAHINSCLSYSGAPRLEEIHSVDHPGDFPKFFSPRTRHNSWKSMEDRQRRVESRQKDAAIIAEQFTDHLAIREDEEYFAALYDEITGLDSYCAEPDFNDYYLNLIPA